MYDFQDIVTLRIIAGLVQQGVRPQTIATSIRKLAAVLPGTERPLAQLKVVAANPGSVLADLGGHQMTPEGQLVLNFETLDPVQPYVIDFPSRDLSAEEWFEHAQVLESEEDLDEAAKAYCKAVELCPHFPVAYFNLASSLDKIGRREEAIQYWTAYLRLDPNSQWGDCPLEARITMRQNHRRW